METFAPTQFFLRVDDKFYPDFVDLDQKVRSNPSFLYVQIFRRCRNRDRCTVPQSELAKVCKCSVRSVQNSLRSLAGLAYIRVEPHPDGTGPNTYVLLLSPRVRFFLRQAGVDLARRRRAASTAPASPAAPDSLAASAFSAPSTRASAPAQNLREGGEKFAPSLRDLRDQDPPLSPPAPKPLDPSPHRGRVRGDLFSSPKRTPKRPPVQAHGRPTAKSEPAADTAADFDRLFSVWPRKQDRLSASRVFASLARTGALPPLEQLLAVVERFKASDRAWRHGCIPNLRFWLAGHRWEDEVMPVQPITSAKDPFSASPAEDMALAGRADHIRRCVERLRAPRPEPGLEAVKPEFEAFLSRFPDGQSKRGPAFGLWALLHRKGKAPTAASVTDSSMGILCYLKEFHASRGVA